MTARYNGLADWYDERFREGAEDNRPYLLELLGQGTGRCLDLGCGTGWNLATIEQTGRSVVGADRSSDQLRLARTRSDAPLVELDGAHLPFRDGAFSTVTTLWISTDVDDFAGTIREAARVLEPGGVLISYGVHPCFNGPHVEYHEDGARTAHTTYRESGRHQPAPYWSDEGIRANVGMRHLPLAEFLTTFLQAGLAIERVMEPREDPVPHALAVRTRRL
ncbi:class I SAM-dependent methyltransferase [Kribbella sp. NBC_01245]|uniref:class I SAM-dependent methyltransferase n=1 Tax=Kribbella sp. NBC_01245 TaxID=2903578 RepID=UPI002E2AB023|nr:class I SAM-dependent methyltransferase [Kribbella sp. NBC_01245]